MIDAEYAGKRRELNRPKRWRRSAGASMAEEPAWTFAARRPIRTALPRVLRA